jgi:hypothetical protein
MLRTVSAVEVNAKQFDLWKVQKVKKIRTGPT